MPKNEERGAVATPHNHDIKMPTNSQDIKTIHKRVMAVLTDTPEARSSDKILISEVYSRFYDVCNEPFWQVMEEMSGLPSFETITRCRRKIQETHEDLRAVDPVEKERINRQIDFIEYAKEA